MKTIWAGLLLTLALGPVGGARAEPDQRLLGSWKSPPYRDRAGYVYRQACVFTPEALVHELVIVTGNVLAENDGSVVHTHWTYDTRPGESYASGARALDLRLVRITETPLSEARAAYYNQIRHCGASHWEAGTARDVTGRPCAVWNGKSLRRGQRIYDIYAFEGETLYFGHMSPGDERAGASASQRPRALDRRYPMAKTR